MFSTLANELSAFMEVSKLYIYPWLISLLCLWGINVINWLFLGSHLNILGIYPRSIFGLLGIIFSPIFHHNFSHLFFNSIPLFVLGLVILSRGFKIFYTATLIITLLGGLLVWLFGRRAIHIGASGLISGYFGFIIITAYSNPSFVTLLSAVLVLYYFGSIFLGIFPQEEQISWESHLFGFLAGIAAGFLQIPEYKDFVINLVCAVYCF